MHVCLPHRDGAFGNIHSLLPLAFDSIEWHILDLFIVDEFRMSRRKDIQVSMKFTFGSKSIGVSWFMPTLVFVFFSPTVYVHRTKTMWVF